MHSMIDRFWGDIFEKFWLQGLQGKINDEAQKPGLCCAVDSDQNI